MQRRVKVVSIADARGLDRGERVEHRARSERQAGLAQGAGEMDDVLRQDAAAAGGSASEARASSGITVNLASVFPAGFPLAFSTGEISLHRRKIIVLPAAVLVAGLAVRNAAMGQRKPRAGLGRRELDCDRRSGSSSANSVVRQTARCACRE